MAAVAEQIAQQDVPSFVAVARALAAGDLTQDVQVTAQPSGDESDEIGVMAADFNEMIDGLQETGAAFAEMRRQPARDSSARSRQSADGLAADLATSLARPPARPAASSSR